MSFFLKALMSAVLERPYMIGLMYVYVCVRERERDDHINFVNSGAYT